MNQSARDSSANLLHVWNAAGEALFACPVEKLSDVQTLKRQLQKLCGAPRFRQRLLHGNNLLDDDAQLDSPIDLQLVLLPFCSTSYKQVIELHDAAENGDVSVLETLLQRPQDPELRLEEGSDWNLHEDDDSDLPDLDDYTSPLTVASGEGHVKIVQLLLEADAEVEGFWEPTFTWTPLSTASQRGHSEIVRLLLKAAANPNGLRQQGASKPLCLAATAGEPSIVRMLLEADADKDTVDRDGETALCKASREGHMEAARLFLNAGADVDAEEWSDSVKETPSHRTLIRPPWCKGTPLCAASELGHEGMVRLLLSAHAYTEARNREGETPLCTAALKGHLVIVQLLLDAFADIDVFDRNGETPLCAASFAGHIDVVAVLLKAGADRDAVNEHAVNVKFDAKRQRDPRQALPIFEKPSPDLFVDVGMTPLCAASCTGRLHIVQLLLDAGANCATPDSKGSTPHSLAVGAGHMKICKLLKAWAEDAQCHEISNKRRKRGR